MRRLKVSSRDYVGRCTFWTNQLTETGTQLWSFDLNQISPLHQTIIQLCLETICIILFENIQYYNMTTLKKTYKKSDHNIRKKIDRKANKLSNKLYLDKKMDCYLDRQSFIIIYYIKRPQMYIDKRHLMWNWKSQQKWFGSNHLWWKRNT